MPSPMYQQFQPQTQFSPDTIRSMVMQRFNIPQNINNPNDIIQHLLNTNQVSQSQVNSAMQMMNNPQIQSMFGGNQNGR